MRVNKKPLSRCDKGFFVAPARLELAIPYRPDILSVGCMPIPSQGRYDTPLSGILVLHHHSFLCEVVPNPQGFDLSDGLKV